MNYLWGQVFTFHIWMRGEEGKVGKRREVRDVRDKKGKGRKGRERKESKSYQVSNISHWEVPIKGKSLEVKGEELRVKD